MKFYKVKQNVMELTMTALLNAKHVHLSYIEMQNLTRELAQSPIIEEEEKPIEKPIEKPKEEKK